MYRHQRGLSLRSNPCAKKAQGLEGCGILVLKNDGLICSKPITIAAKGNIGIESSRR